MNRSQTEAYLCRAYGVTAETPWEKYPHNHVFRHAHNRKWFALIMDITFRHLGQNDDRPVSVINLKCEPELIASLQGEQGLFPAYHMNKNNWISVLLDGSVPPEQLKGLIAISHRLTTGKK